MADADIQTLIEVTGLDTATAKRVYEVCNNDIERAINFHLEGNVVDEMVPVPDSASSSTAAPPCIMPDQTAAAAGPYEDEVRAPIPVKREQLVNDEDDNFRTRQRRPLSHSVCPLRNFQLEGELQEAQLSEIFTGSRSGNMVVAARSRVSRVDPQASKRPRLGDLFRPPVDLIFAGNLHTVREAGKIQDKWIIVNLQDNSQFASQCMNRDIWSDKTLKALIKSCFLFWQVSTDTSEGARFKAFYGVRELPYVCILDPRTGEEKRNFLSDSKDSAFKFTANEFADALRQYIEVHSVCPSTEDNGNAFPAAVCIYNTDNAIELPEQNGEKSARKRNADALDEEEQLRIAIENSLRESKMAEEATSSSSASGSGMCVRNGSSRSTKVRKTEPDALEFDSDSEYDFETESSSQKTVGDAAEPTHSTDYKDFLGAADDPVTRIQLRLPDGQRDNLEWPCSSQIKALRMYVETRYPDVTAQPYKIICAFPRQDLLTLDATETLLSTKLHPNALLHLHQDD